MQKTSTISVSGDLKNNNVYLTAGIQPPSEGNSLMKQVQSHAQFQSYASGGSIMHWFLTEKFQDKQKSVLIKSLFNNFPIRYISLTTVLSVCNQCGCKNPGKEKKCSKCKSTDITIWSRPVGYFRPVLRGNISEDLKVHDYKFWLESRTEEFRRRTDTTVESVDDILKELNFII